MVLQQVKEVDRGTASAVALHPSSNKLMNFGQHSTKTFREAYEKHPSYTAWGFTQGSPGKHLQGLLDFATEMGTMPGLHNEEFNVKDGLKELRQGVDRP